MLIDPGFHRLRRAGIHIYRQGLQQKMVGVLALHDLQAIKNLAMGRTLPNRENHRFAQPALRTVLLQCAQTAMHFHRPFGGLHGELRSVRAEDERISMPRLSNKKVTQFM